MIDPNGIFASMFAKHGVPEEPRGTPVSPFLREPHETYEDAQRRLECIREGEVS